MNRINEMYNSIVLQLNENKRAISKLSEEDINVIISEFDLNKLAKESKETISTKLKELYCVLSNTQTTSSRFHQLLLNTYSILETSKLDKTIYVFFMAAVQKQIIDHSMKTGDRVSAEFMEIIKKLLKNSDPEILEWTLRIIESMGTESHKFRQEILRLRPSLLKIFNKHQKNAFEIVNLLEKTWGRNK